MDFSKERSWCLGCQNVEEGEDVEMLEGKKSVAR